MSVPVHAEEPAPTDPQEFMDLLEYLGSWDGNEADWTQFLSAAEQPPPQSDNGEDRPQSETPAQSATADTDRPDAATVGMQ